MTINDHRSLAERLAGIDEIECVTPDLNGVLRGKVMTAEGSRLSTRGQLKAIIARYAARGLAPVVATELEFFVFAPNTDPTQPFEPPLGLDGRREQGHSAFSVGSNNGLRPFFNEVYECMAALGLPRDTFMHEMGVSQFEINLLHGDPLLLADQTFLFKHLLKEVALKHGLTVVCMAKPLAHTPGSSMHIHQSVVDMHSGRNVFSDEDGNPTATFRHFIGGQQAGMADFTALFAPNVNSYQRLCHPYASPNNACWTHDNRAAGLRIPASAPVARRVENRLPGADANPYLAIAASLAAGLYGIEHELEPTAPIQGEIQVPDELSLPCTLHAALERLRRSQLAKELFGKEFIEGYIASKSMELTSFFDEITPWERRVLAAQA